jgi:hypothetical protein
MDWHEWHRAYDDPESPLGQRLVLVQGCIRAALDALPPGRIRVASMCAGQARDLAGIVDHPRADDLRGAVVELDPDLAAAARDSLPPTIDVVVGDAGLADMYELAVPADVMLVCGVFGNISDDDIRYTIDCLPMLCARGAYVLWTRHRRKPDATEWIRAYFAAHGFEEHTFAAPENEFVGVGMQRFTGEPQPFRPHVRLFTFNADPHNELCPECGFSYQMMRSEILPWLRHDIDAFVETFQARDDVRARPAPDVWSPLEYACHVRDVLRIQHDRIVQALKEDEPTFTPMRREERAVEERYNEQDPVLVITELRDASTALASLLESLDEDGWQRRGVYNYPEPQLRTVEWIAIHTTHEVLHHRVDIGTRA